jgi:uncharacterized membrane protein (TIGR02234 family)
VGGVSDAARTNQVTDDARPGPAARARRGGLVATLLCGAAGSAVVLWAAGETWARGRAATAGSLVPVSVAGKTVTGAPDALALVALAALLAVFAVRGPARTVVCALLALCGAGTVWTAGTGAADTHALDAAAGRASGLSATTAHLVQHTAWPWVAVLGGLLLLVAGVLALLRARTWPVMSTRYERDGTPRPRAARPVADPESPAELWKALDRGEDPTA